jgi:hypothetical protein
VEIPTTMSPVLRVGSIELPETTEMLKGIGKTLLTKAKEISSMTTT